MQNIQNQLFISPIDTNELLSNADNVAMLEQKIDLLISTINSFNTSLDNDKTCSSVVADLSSIYACLQGLLPLILPINSHIKSIIPWNPTLELQTFQELPIMLSSLHSTEIQNKLEKHNENDLINVKENIVNCIRLQNRLIAESIKALSATANIFGAKPLTNYTEQKSKINYQKAVDETTNIIRTIRNSTELEHF